MTNIKRAIILVAGKGTRLLPATLTNPKCLVDVCGRPILLRLLESLHNLKVEEVVLATGYLQNKIKEMIENKFKNLRIRYINNDIYHKTNNIYSLWLTKEFLDQEVLIFGGDILVKENVLKEMIENPNENIGIVSPYYDYLNGTMVSIDNNKISALYLKKDQGADFNLSDKFKTVNIFKLSSRFMKNTFIRYLENHIKKGALDDFYEVTIRDILKDKKEDIYAKIISKEEWFEVDTQQDLKKAEKIISQW